MAHCSSCGDAGNHQLAPPPDRATPECGQRSIPHQQLQLALHGRARAGVPRSLHPPSCLCIVEPQRGKVGEVEIQTGNSETLSCLTDPLKASGRLTGAPAHLWVCACPSPKVCCVCFMALCKAAETYLLVLWRLVSSSESLRGQWYEILMLQPLC